MARLPQSCCVAQAGNCLYPRMPPTVCWDYVAILPHQALVPLFLTMLTSFCDSPAPLGSLAASSCVSGCGFYTFFLQLGLVTRGHFYNSQQHLLVCYFSIILSNFLLHMPWATWTPKSTSFVCIDSSPFYFCMMLSAWMSQCCLQDY